MENLTINFDKTKPISPMLYGIFFEDINRAADGGLYGQLIANNSFEYTCDEYGNDMHFACWESFNAKAKVKSKGGWNTVNPHYAHITANENGGIRNLGFGKGGIGIHKNRRYRLTFVAKAAEPTVIACRLKNSICAFAEASAVINTADWTEYSLELHSPATAEKASFDIVLPFGGEIMIDNIALFPFDTFNGRQNGLRADIAQLIKDLKPKFMRFPGGCIVEGRSFESMYNWKDTIGDVNLRPLNQNRWQLNEYQIPGQNSDDYFQSYGLGFYEYFLFCEDIGAQPVPVMNCGMTCQWHEGLTVEIKSLSPWIDDVLDLIEFANGDSSTNWGSHRAMLGHPEPFNLKYIAIGNEQWGKEYFERYEIFERIISQKHPEIRLITSAGWNSEGKDFDYAVEWMKNNKNKAFAVDEHFYKSPEWFLSNTHRYDNYDRTMPKVFAGEYACHSAKAKEDKRNNFHCALCEAAFMTGMENNADHVWMSCYAPLLAKVGYEQWRPDLIWFDNLNAYGTPSYYVQKMFSTHYGTTLIESSCDSSDVHVSVTSDENGLYIKIVNTSDAEKEISLETLNGRIDDDAKVYIMSAALDSENSIENPHNVIPLCMDRHYETGDILTVPPHSITVIVI